MAYPSAALAPVLTTCCIAVPLHSPLPTLVFRDLHTLPAATRQLVAFRWKQPDSCRAAGSLPQTPSTFPGDTLLYFSGSVIPPIGTEWALAGVAK